MRINSSNFQCFQLIFNRFSAGTVSYKIHLTNLETSKYPEICREVAGLAIDFLEVGASDCESVDPRVEQRLIKWAPPRMGFKLNIACKCDSGSSGVGVGVLIRDSSGLVAAAMETKVEGRGPMVQIQAEAMGIAIQFAFDIGLRHLEVEVGCSDLIALILKGPPCGASCGVLVDDICWWVPRFNVLNFSFISKVCNKAAFALAAEALSSFSAQVWLDDQPDCVTAFVQDDLV
jgi:hypothetical protein